MIVFKSYHKPGSYLFESSKKVFVECDCCGKEKPIDIVAAFTLQSRAEEPWKIIQDARQLIACSFKCFKTMTDDPHWGEGGG